MDIIAEVKLSVPQQFISDDPEKKFASMEELQKERAKSLVLEIEGQSIQIKTGLYGNIAVGRVLKITQVKKKGKLLYP